MASPVTEVWKKAMALSVLLLAISAALAVRQLRSLGWPSVEAQIVASRIVEQRSHDRPGGPEYATFRPEMRYRYLGTAGQPQEATRLVSVWSKAREAADRFVSEYPVGSRVTIRSDPRHPEQVRFGVGTNLATFWQPLAVLAVAVIFAFLAWNARRRAVAAAA